QLLEGGLRSPRRIEREVVGDRVLLADRAVLRRGPEPERIDTELLEVPEMALDRLRTAVAPQLWDGCVDDRRIDPRRMLARHVDGPGGTVLDDEVSGARVGPALAVGDGERYVVLAVGGRRAEHQPTAPDHARE